MVKKKRKGYPYRHRKVNRLGLIVGGAVVPSLIGSAMPGTSGTPLTTIGTGFSHFVAPAVAVTGAGMVFKQLRKFPKTKKRRRR